MNRNQISQYVHFEYLKNIKAKEFWMAVTIMPTLILIIFIFNNNSTKTYDIAVENHSSIMNPIVGDGLMKVTYINGCVNSDKFLVDSTRYDALVAISEKPGHRFVTTFYAPGNIDPQVDKYVRSNLSVKVLDRITHGDYSTIRSKENNFLSFNYSTFKNGKSQYVSISVICVFLLYYLIFQFSGRIMSSISIEKSNKIAEILLTSSNPFDIVFGKILGGFFLSITQVFLWIALFVVEIALVSVVSDLNILSTFFNYISGVMSTLSCLQFLTIILLFLLSLAGGYLLYSCLYAIIGAVSNENTNMQQFSFLLTLPLMFTFVYVFQNIGQNNVTMKWLLYLPVTSPIGILGAFIGNVSALEITTSFILLFACGYFSLKKAAMLYETGVVADTSHVSFKQLLKWLR